MFQLSWGIRKVTYTVYENQLVRHWHGEDDHSHQLEYSGEDIEDRFANNTFASFSRLAVTTTTTTTTTDHAHVAP